MAGAGFRMLVIYLVIGMVLHLGGIVMATQPQDPVAGIISYDPLNIVTTNNNATGLNASFQSNADANLNVATGVFGFIDTLASVAKFITYLFTGMILSPILIFSTYKLPAMFCYIFGGVMAFGLILWFIHFIRSGLSP